MEDFNLMAETIISDSTINSGNLIWTDTMNISLNSLQENLFLAYIPGWNLCVAYWRTGKGWRRLYDNEHISPELVAQINLPNK